jgi:hypothetical protein
VETTQVEPLVALEGRATGVLEGTGRWAFAEDGSTVVTYAWDVSTTKPWMNLVSPGYDLAFVPVRGASFRDALSGQACHRARPR